MGLDFVGWIGIGLGHGSGYSIRAALDSMDPSSLPDFCAIFWRVFSLLHAAFPLSISIPFLPFPLCLSPLFSSLKFCGLKIPKTIDLRTFRKTQFFDLDTDDDAYEKAQNIPMRYCAIVRDPSRDDN